MRLASGNAGPPDLADQGRGFSQKEGLLQTGQSGLSADFSRKEIVRKTVPTTTRQDQFSFVNLCMTENEISYQVRGCVFRVYNYFGPGLLESAYLAALGDEIQECGLKVRTEVSVPLEYKGKRMNHGYRIDLLVEEKVIIEIKSVESLMEVHHKQVITYLRLTGLKLALLVNFNVDDISKGIFRKVNGL